MRLATYNVENLFTRPKVMNQTSWEAGAHILAQHARLNQLFGAAAYSAKDKAEMVEILKDLGLEKDNQAPFVELRVNRGGLLRRPKKGGLEIIADGRGAWMGSLELVREQIQERPILNTARVITRSQADVLAVVEAESRPGLLLFNQAIMPRVGAHSFAHIMLIDGNDRRGIDVGLMTRAGYPIGLMQSHVDDINSQTQELLFSRDCPEFYLTTPKGNRLLVLVNHFKSKGYGLKANNDARRQAQAERVAQLYHQRRQEGHAYIAILGDLNDAPGSEPLAPLHDADLQDISTHKLYQSGGRLGTYGDCGPDDKIDYILLSPALFEKVTGGGIHREGMWAGVRPPKWAMLEDMATEADSASDHALLWADLDI